MLGLITYLALVLMSGALWGLIPLLVGKSTGKMELGKLGMLCSILANLLFMGVVAAIGFLIAILVRTDDIPPLFRGSAPVYHPPVQQPARPADRGVGGLNINCVAGPLVGQVYPIGQEGLLIGRSPSCGLRLPENTPGISREHCSIRWDESTGEFVLEDTKSSYGTFLMTGQKLTPYVQYRLRNGDSFYLADMSNMMRLEVE